MTNSSIPDPHGLITPTAVPTWPDGAPDKYGHQEGRKFQYVLTKASAKKTPHRVGARTDWPTIAEIRGHLSDGGGLGVIASSVGCTVLDIDVSRDGVSDADRQALCDGVRTALIGDEAFPMPAAIMNSASLRGAHLYYRTGLIPHWGTTQQEGGSAFTKRSVVLSPQVTVDVIHQWPLVAIYADRAEWGALLAAALPAPIDPRLPLSVYPGRRKGLLNGSTRPNQEFIRSFNTPARAADTMSALNTISPDSQYDDWVKIGFALKREFGAEGLSLWTEWSARGSKFEGADDLAKRWESFDDRSTGPGMGTIIKLARSNGWIGSID